jgi:poly(glycerol-phosphate) alpha-glucosyltransferase
MKTVNLVQSMSRAGGGLFYSVRRLTESIAELPGMSIAVHSLKDQFSELDAHAWRKIPVTAHKVVGPRKFGYAPTMLRALEEEKPELVHCHGIWMYPSIAAMTWRKRTGRPYMVSPHGMLDPWAVRNSPWKKRLANLLYEGQFQRRAACIRALCTAEAEAIRAYGRNNPIVVIPNGVDLPADKSGIEPEWRSELPAGAQAMLYLGRIHPKKNLENLIRAWARLHGHSGGAKDWHLLIAGWDQDGHEAHLRKLTDELSSQRIIHFIGPQFGEAKHRTLSSADAMILPSLSEGVPMSILEAWAYRMPVAMSAHCNLPGGFAAGAAVEVSTDADAMASQLSEFASLSDERRRLMGAAGHALVESAYAWKTVAGQMIECYRWILDSGPRPATLLDA